MTLASWSDDKVLAQLNSGSTWTASTITYSFAASAGGMFTGWGEAGKDGADFRSFTDAQKPIARLAFALWDDLIASSIKEEAAGSSWSSTHIELGFSKTEVSYAHAYFPSVGSVWLNDGFNIDGNNLVAPTIGRHGFATYIHELGHALGLEHMGEYGTSNAPSSYEDSTVYSIMSYYGPSWGPGASNGEGLVAWADWVGADGKRYSPQTPMVNDVMALQQMYGVDTTTRTGNTTYGFNSNITGDSAAIFNFASNKNPILTIFDSAGTDTLDLSGYTTASSIDLAPGAATSANAMTLNIWIARTAIIENAIGGAGADTIRGNEVTNTLWGNGGADKLYGLGGDDILIGGAGSDTIDGGFGFDLVVLDTVWNAMSVVYDSKSGTFSISGSGWTDTILNVESFQDSANIIRSSDDLLAVATPFVEVAPNLTLTGTSKANILTGGDGDDMLSGLAGNDTLRGGLGHDRLDGGSGKDLMIGGVGDDTYVVDHKSDRITEDLNGGWDTMLTTLAKASLAANVENLTFTGAGAVRATGNALDNVIRGAGGHDSLDGGLGSDTLFGGAGRDVFIFKSALGGGNVDTIADYNVNDDTIHLDNAIFRTLTKTGSIPAGAFTIGSAPADASDRLIFDQSDGHLYYDADGTGAAAQIHFATINLAGLQGTLTAADFLVI